MVLFNATESSRSQSEPYHSLRSTLIVTTVTATFRIVIVTIVSLLGTSWTRSLYHISVTLDRSTCQLDIVISRLTGTSLHLFSGSHSAWAAPFGCLHACGHGHALTVHAGGEEQQGISACTYMQANSWRTYTQQYRCTVQTHTDSITCTH